MNDRFPTTSDELIAAVAADLDAKLVYLVGDATKPIKPEASGPILICHVSNDVRAWGAGFTAALDRAYPGIGALFSGEPRKLGDVHVVEVGGLETGPLFVVNMVAQHGLVGPGNPHPLDYGALAECMRKVAGIALGLSNEPGVFPATIHCPRFGSGLAGGKWETIEAGIKTVWVKSGIDVYVYDLA